jgi:hypothetical protein
MRELAAPNTLLNRAAEHVGAARLLKRLVKRGLDPDALRPAAALALELDQAARNRQRAQNEAAE